jgi:hypothetical protein
MSPFLSGTHAALVHAPPPHGTSIMTSTMRLSEAAIEECVAELRAACRRPIEQPALDTLVGWLRPQFEEILDHAEGSARWADHGPQMRENGRHIGALADFFGHHANTEVVGISELTLGYRMVRAVCRVGGDPAAVTWPDTGPIEAFLREIAHARPQPLEPRRPPADSVRASKGALS